MDLLIDKGDSVSQGSDAWTVDYAERDKQIATTSGIGCGIKNAK